ncbi:MAG: M28 family peptidase, partial [Pirellulales bacterium]
DNASGTAALIEVARRLAARPEKLARRIEFIAFTGEERGLIGSARYCRDPLCPLDKTIAMLNMDMVGRLTDDKLIVQGADTATEFGPIIDELAERYGFKVTKQPGGFGPSDHASFYPHKVPVMHFFTGTHSDYHRPTDDLEKINLPGMRRVADMVTEAVVALAGAEERPHYQAVKAKSQGRGGDRPYFGSIPDFASEEPGYHLGGVSPDSPADKGGLKAGDAIIKLGEYKIGNLEDFDGALRKFKAGDKVPVVVKRDGQEITVSVVLDPPR